MRSGPIRRTEWLPNSMVDLLNRHRFHRPHHHPFHLHHHVDAIKMNCYCYHRLFDRRRRIVVFARNVIQRMPEKMKFSYFLSPLAYIQLKSQEFHLPAL